MQSLDDQHKRVLAELRENLWIYIHLDFKDPRRERLRNRINVLSARDRNLTRIRFDLLERAENEGYE